MFGALGVQTHFSTLYRNWFAGSALLDCLSWPVDLGFLIFEMSEGRPKTIGFNAAYKFIKIFLSSNAQNLFKFFIHLLKNFFKF